MVQDTPSRHLPQFQLRLTPELKEQIVDAAKKANRTMNAEIVSRLEASFALGITVQDGGFDIPVPGEERLEQIEASLRRIEARLEGK